MYLHTLFNKILIVFRYFSDNFTLYTWFTLFILAFFYKKWMRLY